MKDRRDEQAFRNEHHRLQCLHQAEEQGRVEVFYFDEAGFNLTPVVPYAWQESGQTRALPSASSQRINVLGFINKANQSFFHSVIGRVSSTEVIAAFDAFAAQGQSDKLRLVVLDNAPIHRSHAFQDRIDRWLAQGLVVHFLPAYSPELNLIEIVWRKIKYEWLPLNAYLSFDTLKESLADVLDLVGSKYRITFG